MRATTRPLLTLDANIFIAALKADEPHSEECLAIVGKAVGPYLLAEPSILYQEVCGTLARRVGIDVADAAREQLDLTIHPKLIAPCDRAFCVSAYRLCSEYDIYALDALYLKTAIDNDAILISLDEEGFIDRIRARKPPVSVLHVSEFPP